MWIGHWSTGPARCDGRPQPDVAFRRGPSRASPRPWGPGAGHINGSGRRVPRWTAWRATTRCRDGMTKERRPTCASARFAHAAGWSVTWIARPPMPPSDDAASTRATARPFATRRHLTRCSAGAPAGETAANPSNRRSQTSTAVPFGALKLGRFWPMTWIHTVFPTTASAPDPSMTPAHRTSAPHAPPGPAVTAATEARQGSQ